MTKATSLTKKAASLKTKDGFLQTYNAQAGVDTDSRLIVGNRVSQSPNDKQELEPDLKEAPKKTNSPIYKKSGIRTLGLKTFKARQAPTHTIPTTSSI
jgi:hypothetical protein